MTRKKSGERTGRQEGILRTKKTERMGEKEKSGGMEKKKEGKKENEGR